MTTRRQKLKVIPLGGLQEIGKNMTVFEYGDDIFIVDCGLAFPGDEMLGIDLVIPDITYLMKNKEKIRGIVLTHGHEDHIGALPYVLKQINVPVYGTRLTLGLVELKLKEHGILSECELVSLSAGDTITLGCFKIDFIKTNHSIADSVSLAIHTPVGVIVHTGDFKVDYTPIDGDVIDLAKFAELGKKGVLALLCDSTNVERKGYTMSESSVGKTFEDIFVNTTGRIIVASFASNVHRIQQVINAAVKFNRKVSVCGRSMVNVVSVAKELGYLKAPEGVLVDIDEINKYPNENVCIITTGSQGEPMSALARMIASEHKKVQLQPGDLVIISATPIPGNEKFVYKIINGLYKIGATVIYEGLADVHVSGHACQEELKLIHRLVKPKFFIPVHGEYRHLYHHSKLAVSLGMSRDSIFILENGRVMEFTATEAKMGGMVNAGKVLVDGLGVGDVGNIVLRDRKHLSQDGLIVVVVTIDKVSGAVTAGPDIISRGFVYVREAETLMDEARNIVREALTKCESNHITEWSIIKSIIKDVLREMIYEKTKRNPMILPIIMEV